MDHADEDDTSPVLGRSGLVNDAGATQNEVGTDGVHCRAQAMVQDATRRSFAGVAQLVEQQLPKLSETR